MLLRILETDDNNIAFTLYDRGDLVIRPHVAFTRPTSSGKEHMAPSTRPPSALTLSR